MNGSQLIDVIKKDILKTDDQQSITDRALAKRLGISVPGLNNWRTRKNVTPRQINNLMKSYSKSKRSRFVDDCVEPIVEFFEIDRCESSQGARYEIFSSQFDNATNKYREGVKNSLKQNKGIYIFYDSRGKAIYAGKAKRQSLWNEMNNTYNRQRGKSLQSIKNVNHPSRNVEYRPYDEKIRQIRDKAVSMHDIAAYFSAYRIENSLIDSFEAMLIRAFCNDLLNKKMENFRKR